MVAKGNMCNLGNWFVLILFRKPNPSFHPSIFTSIKNICNPQIDVSFVSKDFVAAAVVASNCTR